MVSNRAKEAVTKDISFVFLSRPGTAAAALTYLAAYLFSAVAEAREKTVCNLMYIFLWIAWSSFSLSDPRKTACLKVIFHHIRF